MLYQSSANRIEVHVTKALMELPRMADKTVPELMLPNGTTPVAQAVEFEGRDAFYSLNDAGDGCWKSRPNQSVPMIRHQDVATQEKSHLLSCLGDSFQDDSVFRVAKGNFSGNEVGSDEEYLVR